MNPWLEHVKKFKEQNPGMAYKDVLKNARSTYIPVEKKQRGNGLLNDGKWTAISSLGATARGTISDVSKTVTDRMDKNGTSSSRIANRRRALFRQLKADMRAGNFPRTSDEKLLDYVEKESQLH